MSKPRSKPSDEATAEQLKLACKQGAAYQEALRYIIDKVVEQGGKQEADDYLIAFAQEKAEGMNHLDGDGELTWAEPDGENCHLEIAVCDKADQRFIPGLDIEATLISEAGVRIGPFTMPFLWHPGLYHYGRNITLPGSGMYTLRIRISPPNFGRHDKTNGKRYARTVEVEFAQVPLKAGS